MRDQNRSQNRTQRNDAKSRTAVRAPTDAHDDDDDDDARARECVASNESVFLFVSEARVQNPPMVILAVRDSTKRVQGLGSEHVVRFTLRLERNSTFVTHHVEAKQTRGTHAS